MAEKSRLLTKKLEECKTYEEQNKIGESIKGYESIIKEPL